MKNYFTKVLTVLFFLHLNLFAQVPTITSILPISGSPGTEITITGTNFNTTLSNNFVWFDNIIGNVTNVTATEMKVKVPFGATSTQLLVVSNKLAVLSSQYFILTYPNGGAVDTTMFAKTENISYKTSGGNMYANTIINADLNNDGLKDILIINSGSLMILQNNSQNNNIKFYDVKELQFFINGYGNVADLNNDGKLDIYYIQDKNVKILKNTSSLTEIKFEEAQSIEVSSASIISLCFFSEDLNNDGKKEIIIGFDYYESVTRKFIIKVLKNNSSTSISFSSSPIEIYNSTTGFNNLQLADFNNDKKVDLVLTDNNYPYRISFLQNNTTGSTFTSTSFVGKGNLGKVNSNNFLSISDFNNDGASDFVNFRSSWTNNKIDIYLNKNTTGDISNNLFDSLSIDLNYSDYINNAKLSLDDFNGDGKIDIALLTQKNIYFVENTTSSTVSFDAPIKLFNPYQSTSILSKGDLNNDGFVDLILQGKESTDLLILKHSTVEPKINFLTNKIEFGMQKLNIPSTYTLKITNESYLKDLVISSATIVSSEFQISPSSKTIAKKDTATFTITYKPTSVKLYSDSIKFTSNDLIKSIYFIPVSGSVNPLTNVTPAFNAIGIKQDANIVLEFAFTVNQTDIDKKILVSGSNTGSIKSNYSVSGAIVTINPDKNFKAGEEITVVINNLKGTAGDSLLKPLSYKFNVATKSTSLQFVETFRFPYPYNDQYKKKYSTLIDMDNDGDEDLIVYMIYEYFKVYKNEGGNLIFWKDIQLNFPVMEAVFLSFYKSDLNNDGLLDLILDMGSWDKTTIYQFENDGKGSFNKVSEVTFLTTHQESNHNLLIDDFNNDGLKELIVFRMMGGAPPNASYSLLLIKNVNKILKDTTTLYNMPNANFSKLGSGDLDNDGDNDLIVLTQTSLNIFKNINLVNKEFENVEVLKNSNILRAENSEINLADFNNDGLLDITFCPGDYSSSKINIYENGGNLSFIKKTTLTNNFNSSLKITDLNGDDKQDIAFINKEGTNNNAFDVTIAKNNGDFTFEESKIHPITSSSSSPSLINPQLQVSDLDLDNDVDLFLSSNIQLNVLKNRNNKADLNLASMNINLGVLKVDSTFIWKEVVKNYSIEENLIISDVKSTNSEITFTPSNANIPAGDSATFTFTFKPKQSKKNIDTITFTSNDLNKLKTNLEVKSVAVKANSIVKGAIKTNITWTKEESPFVVFGQLTINEEAILTIDNGVIVWVVDTSKNNMYGASRIIVKGIIKINGTPDSRVQFDNLFADKKWGGFSFENNNNALKSSFRYVDILNSTNGINNNSWGNTIDSTKFIVGAKFINNYQAVYIQNGIIDSLLVENCGTGVKIYNGKILNSSIINCYVGIDVENGQPSIIGNTIKNNITGIKTINSESTFPILFGNLIENNNIGLTIEGGSPKSNGNTISKNKIGIEFTRNNTWLTFKDTVNKISFNNISENETYNVLNRRDKNRLLFNNYWGTTDTLEIAKKIHDSFDSDSVGTIFYKPFLLEKGGTPNTPPKLNFPDSNAINVTLPINFKWQQMLAVEKYHLQVSTSPSFATNVMDLESNINSVNSSGLTSNTKYYWRVRLYNPFGYGVFTSPWPFYTIVLPPDSISSKVENQKIHLKWSATKSQNILRYKIYRDTTNIVKTLIDSVLANILTYPDSNLINGKKYYYKISSVNQDLIEGPMSVIHESSPKNAPPIPVRLVDNIDYKASRQLTHSVSFNSQGSYDSDGKIDSMYWFVDNKLINKNSILNYEFPQGTSFVKLIVQDNEGARDSSEAKVIRASFKQSFNGKILSGVTSIGETVFYVIAENDAVYQLNYYGDKVYDIKVNGNIKSSSSVSFDTIMYIGSTDRNLYAFNNKGNNIWVEALGGELVVSPTIDSTLNRIYIGVSNNNFKAVNRTTGKVDWSFFTDAAVKISAVITKDRKLVFVSDAPTGTVYGINLVNNPTPSQENWKISLGERITSSPAVDENGNFYVGTAAGKLIKIAMRLNENAIKLWQFQSNGEIVGSPVIDGSGNVYFGSADGYLYSINSSNGSLKWKFNSKAQIKSTPTLSSTKIYFANINGEVWGLDTLSNINFYYKDADPISASLLHFKGTLLVGTEGKNVLAFYDGVDVGNLEIEGVKLNADDSEKNKFLKRSSSNNTIASAVKRPIWGTFQGNNQRTGDFSTNKTTFVNDDILKVPTNYILSQNYPNPFNPSTIINFGLPEESKVLIEIYNIVGQKVKTLMDEVKAPGYYSINFNEKIKSGIYFYRMVAVSQNNPTKIFRNLKKMVLLK